jgi:hypothetical protein
VATKTIKPDGGGDYADLATWEAWADDEASADQTAECYDGTGDLGEVYVAGWSATPDSGNYPRIFAPLAERHDGTKSSSGAWVDVDSATTGIDIHESYARVEGIRIMMSSTGMGLRVYSDFFGETTTGQIIDSNLFIVESGGNPTYAARAQADAADLSCDFRNNILYNDGSGNIGIEVMGHSPSPPVTVSFTVQNNSVDGFNYGINMSEGSYTTATVTLENNICTNNSTWDFGSVTGSPTITGNNNCSEDATADDWDGSGSIINQTPSNLFVTEGSDLNLKAGSNAIDAGKTIAGWDNDALHLEADNWRPQGSAWDMGALEKEQAAPAALPAGSLALMGVGI